MKNKIILFIVIGSFIACTKNSSHHHNHIHNSNNKNSKHSCTNNKLDVSPDLVPYFDAFIDDCKKHNINYDHVYCLDILHFDHLRGSQGITYFHDKDISIRTGLKEDSIGMRFVVYHEIGHWMGLDHGTGIMQKSYNTEEDMEWVKENWDELVEDYFSKLKN